MQGVILVTGDRHATIDQWHDVIYDAINKTVDENPDCTSWMIVHGAARGIDSMAGTIARAAFGFIENAFPAQWKQHGKQAGPMRNRKMVEFLTERREVGDRCFVFAFHDDLPNSKGTKNCVEAAMNAGFAPHLFLSTNVWEAYANDQGRL